MSDTINILLVDDEARNLDALEAILEDPAYRLLRATDADTALRLLLENEVAAIVLDIKMPGVSGFELATIIKGTKKFRQIPIVFLTAYLSDDKDIIAGYGTGAVDYLTKPVNSQILRLKVGIFADLFRKTRALAELNDSLEARVQERTTMLEQSESALRLANEQKDRFLATLAHELRNPLAPLRTGLDLLLHEPSPDLAARAMATMNRQLDHLVRLVDDLLDVSRINHGKVELRREYVALSTIIERAAETAAPSYARRNQILKIDNSAEIHAWIDPTRIAQIIANLLHNASKHSAAGATVRVEMHAEGANAIIRIIDHGTGIPADQLERVFEMFTKVGRAALTVDDGLGIGLALARQLATLHDGFLTVESAGEGQGATFVLSLPISTQPADEKPTFSSPKGLSKDGGCVSLNIVLAEDNEDSAEMMLAWLERLGHRVRVAHNGPDAVALICEARPHAVLCDIGLPGFDGVDVCRQVIEKVDPPPMMIAMTGWGMEADRARTDAAGFRHHLVKPVALDKLQMLLDSIETRIS